MTIDEFLKRSGRMAMDDVNVGFSRVKADGTHFWLDAGDRWVRTFISNLEVMQNRLSYSLLQGPEYAPGCNPRCSKEHIDGYDQLHVGPTADVVFKMGHENDGTPFGRVSGPDDTPHCGRCYSARKSIAATERRAIVDLLDNRLKKAEAEMEIRLGWAGNLTMVPKSTSKQLTLLPLVAAMDKAGRSQLRKLVNEKVPNHLLGAPIASVKEALMGNAVEVTVVGDEGGYLLMEKELDAAGLTVTKAVTLWR